MTGIARQNFAGRIFSIVVFTLLVNFCQAQEMQTLKYRVIAYNQKDNSVVSQSNIAEIAPAVTLYMANTFTPNGDGLNDQFGAVGRGIKTYSLKVYNRWGEVVFETDDINAKWDGRYKGELVPSGVFVYQVEALGITGGAIYKHGSVTVLY
jgi:gliding motility-associated-like protein